MEQTQSPGSPLHPPAAEHRTHLWVVGAQLINGTKLDQFLVDAEKKTASSVSKHRFQVYRALGPLVPGAKIREEILKANHIVLSKFPKAGSGLMAPGSLASLGDENVAGARIRKE